MNSTKQLVKKLEQHVTHFLRSLQKTYEESSVQFLIEREYLQKVIMSLVAPVNLNIRLTHRTPYFTMLSSFDTELRRQNGQWVGYTEKQKEEERPNEDPQLSGIEQLERGQEPHDNNPKTKGHQAKKQQKSRPQVLPGTCRNKNMVYGIHPTAISLTKQQEQDLCDWVKARTKQRRPVSRILLRKKARKMLGCIYFQATEGWVRRFLVRHPEIKDYLSRNSEYAGEDSQEMNSSGSWIGTPDDQVSREEFLRLGKQEQIPLEEVHKIMRELDPRNTGFIPYSAIERLQKQYEQDRNN